MVSRRPPDIFDEYVALLADYGSVQKHCTRLFASQAAEIERLQADAMRLRAAIITRDTALAALRDELAALHAAVSGLPERRQLAHDPKLQRQRIRRLLRERMDLRQQLKRSSPSTVPMDVPITPRRATIIERLLPTVTATVRTAAQRWKQIRMLRI
jgi:hypothetical protein